MTEENWITVLVTLVGALTSANAWQFWKQRVQAREDQENMYRDDLRSQVESLTVKLTELQEKRESEMAQMNDKIRELSEELAAMRTTVDFLQRENNELRGNS